MKLREKIGRELNDRFRDVLAEAMMKKWGVAVESQFDILGSMKLVTTRVDGEPFTDEQYLWLGGFSEGFNAAIGFVRRG